LFANVQKKSPELSGLFYYKLFEKD